MQIIYFTGNVIFIHELDIRISDFDQRARAPFRRQNRTQEYFSISSGLRACAIDSHVTVPVRTQRGKFKIAMLFQVHE